MSLIHWWPLINDTHDNGTAALNLTTVGSLGFTGAGKIGSTGATFTSDAHALKATDLSTLHSFTKYSMACWVKLTANATNHSSSFLSSGNWNSSASQVCFGLYNPGNGYTRLLVPNGSSFTGAIPIDAIALNVWHHYIITYDGITTKGYIDGTYVGSYDGGGISTTEVTYYYLGAATYYNGFTMKGVMNDFRIYDHTLSLLEINELAKGLVLHYDFEDPYMEPTTNLFYNKVIGFSDGDRWKIVTDYPAGITPQYRVYKQTSSNSYFGSASTFLANTSSPTSYNGKKFTLSGLYYRPSANAQPPYIAVFGNNGSTSYASITTPIATSDLSIIGKWTPFYITIQFNSNLSSFSQLTYIKSPEGLSDPLYLADLQFEEKDHTTPFARGTRTSELCYDSSGYNYHGTLSDNTAQVKQTASGRGKYALLINANTYISHPRPLGQAGLDQEWTVNTWVYPTSNSGGAQINNFNQGNYIYYNANGLLYLNSGTNDYYRYTNSTIPMSQWNMLTFVFKNSSGLVKIYNNGIDVTGTGPNKTSTPSGLSVTIQCFGGFSGYVGDYSIYATALSAAQVKTLYERKAAISKNGALVINNLHENSSYQNMLDETNRGILIAKTWNNQISQVNMGAVTYSFIDSALRVYRAPNHDGRAISGSGWDNWGGIKITPLLYDSTSLQKGHRYLIKWHVKGKTCDYLNVGWTNNLGWSGGGLDPHPSDVTFTTIDSNFQGEKDCYYYFTITDDVYKVCTSSYSSFVKDQTYPSYRDFGLHFGYSYTNELGTDVYFSNFRMYDITGLTNQQIQILISSTVQCEDIYEKGDLTNVQFGHTRSIMVNHLIET